MYSYIRISVGYNTYLFWSSIHPSTRRTAAVIDAARVKRRSASSSKYCQPKRDASRSVFIYLLLTQKEFTRRVGEKSDIGLVVGRARKRRSDLNNGRKQPRGWRLRRSSSRNDNMSSETTADHGKNNTVYVGEGTQGVKGLT